MGEIGRYEVEQAEEWRKAIPQIPALKFPAAWAIQIIPPFGGALARFVVTKGEAWVSVYADFYDALGYFGAPHWEIYPDADGDNLRFAIADASGLISAIGKSINRPLRT